MPMPNRATSSAFVETATKCFAIAVSSPPRPRSSHARAVPAFVIVSRVVKVFEDTMKSVSAGSRSRVASRKSAPSTFDTKRNVRRPIAEGSQGLGGHHRPQIRAADPDVHDVADLGARVPAPGAVPHRAGESGHPVEDLVHVGDHVAPLSTMIRAPAARGAPRGARAILGHVDPVATEHRIDALAQAALLRELDEEPDRLVGDAVLRVIEEQAGGSERQALASARVGREEIAQMHVPDSGVMRLERPPRAPLPEGDRAHVTSSDRTTSRGRTARA